ncbi:MAG: efflux RND transporter periplasmic adaptor subunit, partial [Gemmatimonadota bacterium]
MSTKKQVLYSILLLVLAGGVLGFYHVRSGPAQDASGMSGHNHAAMGGGGGADSGAAALDPVKVTPTAARTIGITYAVVVRKPLASEVRTLGTVQYDETRLADVSPKIEGWVEKLDVDFTGAPVKKGQPMLEVYSPKLVSAQEELILARKLADEA